MLRESRCASIPGYAEAHVGLAHYYVVLARSSLAEPRKVLPKAKTAAERAMEADPTLAHAHSALAQVVLWSEHAWPEAQRHFRRALVLAPSLALVYIAYGALYLRPLGCSRRQVESDQLFLPYLKMAARDGYMALWRLDPRSGAKIGMIFWQWSGPSSRRLP